MMTSLEVLSASMLAKTSVTGRYSQAQLCVVVGLHIVDNDWNETLHWPATSIVDNSLP